MISALFVNFFKLSEAISIDKSVNMSVSSIYVWKFSIMKFSISKDFL